MPDFPIIDSHVHLWDPAHFRMEWLDANQRLNKTFGLAEYDEHTAGIQVEGMVYLEVDLAPEYKLLEAQWVDALAQQDGRLKAIVASAPLEYGEQVRAFLEALVAVGPRVKGVRRLLQGESDPAYCLQPRFVRGVQLLPEFGLSFDICVYHPQLASAVELVRRCPETSFILDHIGKPNIRGHQLDPWRSEIDALAALPNVVCKVSGATTEADLEHWTVDDVAPYVNHVLAAFGEDRVVYGGDWPVVLNASPYKRWAETLDTLTASLSPQAKRKLWADNARRFYRLDEGGAG
ncbi:MAG: L-fuconolactone hydrolase [uncultured Chloroflexi bacterium]|uniref:L-fuconolactone hydrolase n=1 Tax=uncultured Chloroflexota bacterium TaxID=166587 RepID=A0A6J4JIR6_9CHLR|nr:MAG: L-fuconolactone hydrolase [uncultured Chloroflexota bacterium]